jgi:lysophospholipase L1-like esterase
LPPIRFLALGDSYTIGEGVPVGGSWPVQLAARLRASGFPTEEPLIVARTGWTTSELKDGITRAGIAEKYDLVSLLIGVNNQYRGEPQEVYRREFSDLVALAIHFAGDPRRVMALSIPDWGVTTFAEGRDRQKIAREIDAFNAINREEAEEAGAVYIDVTGISRQASSDPGLIAEDGLHPSVRMYTGWVDLIEPTVLDILKSDCSKTGKKVVKWMGGG